MAPPKRALFSLNLDTDADHVYQKVEDHNQEGADRVKVLESKGPTHGHSDLSYVTRPFEKTVNRAVNEVIEGSGRKVKSAEGEISYSTTRTERRSGGSSRRNQDTEDEDRNNSRLNVVSKTKRRNIERKYDTSEL
jgi:ribose 5-phosphate isomerase B